MEHGDVVRAEVQPYDAAGDIDQARSEDGSYLDTPWRDVKIGWEKKDYNELLDRIASSSPRMPNLANVNVLLIGPIGSGKSSFINSVFSAIRNDLGQLAYNARDDKSTTCKLKSYRLRESRKSNTLNITLHDTMGFEGNCGPTLRDIEYIMDGHIRDGYKFESSGSIFFKDPHFNPDPREEDKIHVVVVVVDALPMSTMDAAITEKIRSVTRLANDKEIRWCVVMTKIDNACALVYNDVTTVFASADIQNCVEVVGECLGCHLSNIFPVQNYAEMDSISLPVSILTLHTLENILRLAAQTMELTLGAVQSTNEDDAEANDMALLDAPWRTMTELSAKAAAEFREKLVLPRPKRIECTNLCLIGPVGGGKSSFINTVLSTFRGKIMTNAETGKKDAYPVTLYYREYKLRQGASGEELGIKLVDTMGLMSAQGGILTEDIPTILDGKVDNVFPLNPAVPLQTTGKPLSLKTRVHALVLVVNAVQFLKYDKSMVGKMKDAMAVAKGQPRDIPRIVVLTHVDALCPHVKKDVCSVFRSQAVLKTITDVHETLQVPQVDILPVCNYTNEFDVDPQRDTLVLMALHHLVQRAEDYIDNCPIEEWEKPPQGFLRKLFHWFGW